MYVYIYNNNIIYIIFVCADQVINAAECADVIYLLS